VKSYRITECRKPSYKVSTQRRDLSPSVTEEEKVPYCHSLILVLPSSPPPAIKGTTKSNFAQYVGRTGNNFSLNVW
jgi:hypothetical protein